MIDLCVVTYKTPKLLKRLIDVLHADERKPHPWRLWIANNGNDQETFDYLNALCVDHPSWGGKVYEDIAVWNLLNPGYAGACNFLAAQGHGDVIGLLNADVWMTTQDVINIQRLYDSEPSISIVGPKQRNEQNRVVHAGIIGTNTTPKHQGWMAHDPMDRLHRVQMDCVTVSGSAYFIRRDVWNDLKDCPTYKDYVRNTMRNDETLGAFLPTRHYYEETACSYHARAHGYRVTYEGRISIGHTWHASSPPGAAQDGELMRESREHFRGFCQAHDIPHD